MKQTVKEYYYDVMLPTKKLLRCHLMVMCWWVMVTGKGSSYLWDIVVVMGDHGFGNHICVINECIGKIYWDQIPSGRPLFTV